MTQLCPICNLPCTLPIYADGKEFDRGVCYGTYIKRLLGVEP